MTLSRRQGWLKATARLALKRWIRALAFFLPFFAIGLGQASSDGALSPADGLFSTLLFIAAVYVGAFVLTAVAPRPEQQPARYMVGWGVAWVAAVVVFLGVPELVTPTSTDDLVSAFVLFGLLGIICGPVYGALALDWRSSDSPAEQERRED